MSGVVVLCLLSTGLCFRLSSRELLAAITSFVGRPVPPSGQLSATLVA